MVLIEVGVEVEVEVEKQELSTPSIAFLNACIKSNDTVHNSGIRAAPKAMIISPNVE
jgi:hypothetical protein